MIIEISVSLIALSCLVVAPFFIRTLLEMKRTLSSVRKDLHHLSIAAIQLTHKLNRLASSFVEPFSSDREKKRGKDSSSFALLDWVTASLEVVEMIQQLLRRYAK